MYRRILRNAPVAVLLCFAIVSVATFAEENPIGPGRGEIYVAPGAVYFESTPGTALERSETGFGGVLGVGLTDRLAIELLFSEIDMAYAGPGVSGRDETQLLWLDLLYQLRRRGSWQPFVVLGGGSTKNDLGRSGLARLDDTQVNVGAGAFFKLSERFSLRADVRANYSDDQNKLEPAAFLGLTAFLGSASRAARIEPEGDGDGVANAGDACPGSSVGAAVDGRGCPLDGDRDGVPDDADLCPGSEAGARVDERGCYVELEETLTLDLNLEFDSNSAALRPDHYGLVDPVVAFLREYPTANAIIEGHTDSDGGAAYNQTLSEQRAAAVRDYLVERGGIDAARLRSVGYGETRPVADNDTAQGKQHNRRVTAVISGRQTVRQ